MANKEGLLTVRVTTEKLQEFQAACELEGLSMSGFVHQHIIKTIREVESRNPVLFQETLQRLKAIAEEKAKEKKPAKPSKPLRKAS